MTRTASPDRCADPRFVAGRGRFTDDTAPADALWALFLRAPLAHARVRALDLAPARALPGIVGLWSGADLAAAGAGPLPALARLPDTVVREPPRPAVAVDRIRYSGEILAVVVADHPARGLDALEAVAVDLEPLPAVVEPRAAAAPDAPQLHASVPGNLACDWRKGDPRAVEAAFARAHRVVRLRERFPRIAGAYLEPRAVWAAHDPGSGVTTVTVASQGAHVQHRLLCAALGWRPESLRVVTEDVGGGFGPKFPLYPETLLVAWAARRLGRTVRWTASRTEHFLADAQARDLDAELALALDTEGRFLALRFDAIAGLGAWLSSFAAIVPTTGASRVIGGLYRIPAIDLRVRLVYTNTAPVDAFRGAGKPEALYLLERAIDEAAASLGLDPVAIRQRNLLRPEDFPWTTPLGYTYEPFDAPALLERALFLGDRAGFAARREAARNARGALRGFGLACHLHPTGALPGETARVVLAEDGTVEAWTGTQDTGQGHGRALARLLADILAQPPERLRVRQGDTAALPDGPGTGGSSSMVVSGNSLARAARRFRSLLLETAAELLEADPLDLRLVPGAVEVVGTDRRISLAELSRRAAAHGRPLRVEQAQEDPAETWPAAVTTAEVEIDPETGALRVVRMATVLDIGAVLDPAGAQGQVHGGIAAGLGEALCERIVYDPESGQLLSGSFLDYAVPRAREVAPVEIAWHGVPGTRNPLGIKGLGELPTNGALAAIGNAVFDALRPRGVGKLALPFLPERIWRAIREAAGQKGE
ncbi:MAG: xanthine dehydrogenase family protein molybdopterin-binding subunit [Geminicoccaceae bacterium]|nr:xanthine dehydrogenase family protein molybdopterin-binding subunit [Geminicoccaceae bacterium]MDW8341281.1 xanthine dehydrogenase family protein molybdopterin-binding subunit [Geminicoccaceae bacterium]